MSRSQIVRHHRDIGTLTSPLLIVTLLTGSLLTLRPVADFLFSPLSPSGTIAESLAPPKTKGGALAAELRLGRDAANRAAHVSPKPSCAASVFRHPRAGSSGFARVSPTNGCPTAARIFWFDPADGRLVHVVNAQSLPLATKAFNLVYPLHASTVGGFIYKAAMTAAGLALTLLGTLAVYGFWRHRVRRTVPGRVSAEAPVSLPD